MRAAIASTGRIAPDSLFPEMFPSTDEVVEPGEVQEDVDDSETEFDYSAVKWETPEDGDREAIADLLSVMGQHAVVDVTDLDDEIPAVIPFIDNDREWV